MHKSFKTVDVIHLKGEKCMSKWSGRYEDTKESERSLEEETLSKLDWVDFVIQQNQAEL